MSAFPKVIPGGFWRRVIASMIDAAVLGLVQLPIALLGVVLLGLGPDNGGAHALGSILNGLGGLTVSALYYGRCYQEFGATPGKLLMGLRVVKNDTGTYVSFWRAAGREIVGKFISVICLFLGFLMIAVRSDKRGLHDLMFDTRVVQIS